MGELISTGVVIYGHTTQREYLVVEGVKRCWIHCTCGWKDEIEHFNRPWSIIEIQRKFERHLIALGVPLEQS